MGMNFDWQNENDFNDYSSSIEGNKKIEPGESGTLKIEIDIPDDAEIGEHKYTFKCKFKLENGGEGVTQQTREDLRIIEGSKSSPLGAAGSHIVPLMFFSLFIIFLIIIIIIVIRYKRTIRSLKQEPKPVSRPQERPGPPYYHSPGPTGSIEIFNNCPYCGKPFNLKKQPRYCPYCNEDLT